MSIHLHWYLPTNGDSRGIMGSGDDSQHISGIGGQYRAPSLDYLIDIARSADKLGFEGILTPTGSWCEDAWLSTIAISQHTERLKFIVAFRPGFISPTLAAHQAATYQRLTDGRLILNIVTGGDPVEQRRYGDRLSHDQRYARSEEFIAAFKGVSHAKAQGQPFDFQGEHYQLEQATLLPSPWPVPEVFFGGSSPAAQRVAANVADTWLSWGEPLEQVAAQLATVRGLAAQQGRTPSFGIRFHVISRDTEEDAWLEAARLLKGISPERIKSAQSLLSRTESVGQQRMTALLNDIQTDKLTPENVRLLEIAPHIWSGYALVRGGVGTAIVGSHQQVADTIQAYHALGIDHFILSGQPHLEEAYWFAEGAGALLRRSGLVA
ncbi:LLM class flavin-dependent oxidoreductase [Klebsiella sp. BIGb0407]|uniref:LLM class flavin-dependent oxidoreductase n=1 Tax=Klebsiella sp. BIGb0407 TaxID=2940603 RepID=UPI0021674F36|nr:LLM class flavin-dependent oxidoreductase [Klebsiella sp. BIGb0407]MCS3432478.1 alkanesulfonate monooxygenase [Klebsiella sp. BIGb0407]